MVLYIYTAIANKSIRVIYYRYSNIRRRGDVGGSAKKMGMRIRELERLYGVRDGSAGGSGDNQYTKQLEPNKSDEATPQEQLASQMGISVDTLQNYKLLSDMIPELVELLRINLMALYLDTEKRIILYVVEQ